MLGLHIIFYIFALNSFFQADGGSCWVKMDENGKCRGDLWYDTFPILGQYDDMHGCCLNGLRNTFYSNVSMNKFHIVERVDMVIERKVECIDCRQFLKDKDCSTVECPPYWECVMEDGKPTCTCDFNCSEEDENYKARCGSDDHTFHSICQFKRWRCQNPHLYLAYNISCMPWCSNKQFCPAGTFCKRYEDEDRAACLNCSLCPQEPVSKVCSTKLKQYDKSCEYFCANPKGEVHFKDCPSVVCENAKCPEDKSTCIEKKGRPYCIDCTKPNKLSKKSQKQCDVDGNEFPNEHFVTKKMCAERKFIKTKPC
uniref:Follistatin n=1 Tax=Hofstenia miamia TaxID=442651 RepID=A0A8K1R442_HOFMI|nr:follistatin [Hofstenia miamia]